MENFVYTIDLNWFKETWYIKHRERLSDEEIATICKGYFTIRYELENSYADADTVREAFALVVSRHGLLDPNKDLDEQLNSMEFELAVTDRYSFLQDINNELELWFINQDKVYQNINDSIVTVDCKVDKKLNALILYIFCR